MGTWSGLLPASSSTSTQPTCVNRGGGGGVGSRNGASEPTSSRFGRPPSHPHCPSTPNPGHLPEAKIYLALRGGEFKRIHPVSAQEIVGHFRFVDQKRQRRRGTLLPKKKIEYRQ